MKFGDITYFEILTKTNRDYLAILITCGIRNLSCHDFCATKMHAMVPERHYTYWLAPTTDIAYHYHKYPSKDIYYPNQ